MKKSNVQLIIIYILVTILCIACAYLDFSVGKLNDRLDVLIVKYSIINGCNAVPDISIPEVNYEYESEEAESEPMKFIATAYCSCEKCCGKWALNRNGPATGASGMVLQEGYSVAVDNSIYKFGTIFEDENGHQYIAADTGGAIKGNHIDIYFESHDKALEWGRREMLLTIKE